MKQTGMLFWGILRRRWVWYLPAALCAFWSFLAYFGLSSIEETLLRTQVRFVTECGKADVYLYCEETDARLLRAALSEIPGTAAADSGLYYEERCTGADGNRYQIRFFGLRETAVLHPYLTSSEPFAVSRGYCADYGAFQLRTLTRADGTRLCCAEAAYLPMYTGVYLDRCLPSTDSGFADVYADYQTVCMLRGEETVNFAAVRLAEGTSAQAYIDAMYSSDQITVTDAYDSAEEPAYRGSAELCDMVVGVCRVFSLLLCGTGMFFALLFLSGAVSRIRPSMSVLCADGLSAFALFLPVCLCAAVSLFCGLLTAIPAAYALSGYASAVCLRNMGIFESTAVLPPVCIAKGILFAVLTAVCSAAIGAAGIGGRTVRSVQRRSMPLFAVRLLDFAAVAVCTAVSVLMIASTAMFRDSIETVRHELYADRCAYDALVIYNGFVPLTELDELAAVTGIQTAEPMLLGTAELRSESAVFQAAGLGIAEESSTVHLYDAAHSPLYAEGNRILLSKAAADQLCAGSGDILTAEIICKGKRTQISCLAAGVSEQYTSFQEIFSIRTAEQYLDSAGLMNCAAVLFSDGAEESLTMQQMRSLPEVYTVQSHAQAEQRFDRRYSGTLRLIRLIAADGMFLGFSVLLLTAFASYRRNLCRNSVLVMLGAPVRHILLPELLRQLSGVLTGCVLAVPFCSIVVRYLLAQLSAPSVIYPYVFYQTAYLRCCIPLILFAIILVVCFSVRAIRKAGVTAWK